MINSKKIFGLIILIAILLQSSCIVVKYDNKDEQFPELELSPKPEIAMSEEFVRSREGDMLAFLPESWFFVDVEDRTSSEVFAVAVNPDYTLSAVFTRIKTNSRIDKIVKSENLHGLARVSFDRQLKKSGGSIKQVGKFNSLSVGALKFGSYKMLAPDEKLPSLVAVFKSSLGRYYQFALVPMDITKKPMPSELEFEKIFSSILTTIQY